MSNTLLQSKTASYSNVQNPTITFDSACTSGSLLLAVCTNEDIAHTAADPTNGAWARDVTVTESGGASWPAGTDIFSVQNTGTTALTVTFTGSANSYGYMTIKEYSGAATSSALDKSGSFNNELAATTLTLVGCAANDTIIAGWAGYGGGSGGADTGFTLDVNMQAINIYHHIEYDDDAGAAGDKTLTLNGQTAPGYRSAFAVAAYKTAAGGGGGTVIPVLMHQYRQRTN